MDEIGVKLRIALGIVTEAVHEIAQFFLALIGHGSVGLPLFVGKVHGLTVQLQIFHSLLPGLLHFHFFLGPLFCLGLHSFFGKKKAIEGTVKNPLFLPGFCKNRSQSGFHQRIDSYQA